MSTQNANVIPSCKQVWETHARFKNFDLSGRISTVQHRHTNPLSTADDAKWRKFTELKRLKRQKRELKRQRAVWKEIQERKGDEMEYRHLAAMERLDEIDRKDGIFKYWKAHFAKNGEQWEEVDQKSRDEIEAHQTNHMKMLHELQHVQSVRLCKEQAAKTEERRNEAKVRETWRQKCLKLMAEGRSKKKNGSPTSKRTNSQVESQDSNNGPRKKARKGEAFEQRQSTWRKH